MGDLQILSEKDSCMVMSVVERDGLPITPTCEENVYIDTFTGKYVFCGAMGGVWEFTRKPFVEVTVASCGAMWHLTVLSPDNLMKDIHGDRFICLAGLY